MRFVVVTHHFAGLGFALRLVDEGHDVVVAYRGIEDSRLAESYDLVGNGMVGKVALRDAMNDRQRYRDAYWIWDENHSVEDNEQLRAEGFRVLGGGRYADTMEHVDRLEKEADGRDANFIASRDGVWFFEKCERFGYNAHPNLLWNLNRDALGDTFAALVDGSFHPNFSPGFGASCTMYMDHRGSGRVIQFPESIARDLYLYDAYKDGELLLTAGYYDDVLVATGFGYTIPTAWEAVLEKARAVKFPGRSFRLDGGGTDFPSSPLRRYEALQAMGWLWSWAAGELRGGRPIVHSSGRCGARWLLS